MRLPHPERAIIDPRKLRDYALSPEHPVGRFKATFFAALGFTRSNWERFELQVRQLALNSPAEEIERNAFGQKYLTRGKIVGRANRSAAVVAVWIVLTGEDAPRLVTVYPET